MEFIMNPQIAKPTRAASVDVIQRVRHVIFTDAPIFEQPNPE